MIRADFENNGHSISVPGLTQWGLRTSSGNLWAPVCNKCGSALRDPETTRRCHY